MDKFIRDIEHFAQSVGLHPSTVVQRAAGLGGATWARWKSGGGCTVATMDKINSYIAAQAADQAEGASGGGEAA